MGNRVLENYFSKGFISLDQLRIKSISDELIKQNNFQIQKILSQKTILSDDRIYSVEMQGEFESKKAVLKIQGLKLQIEEFELMRRFEEQNKSKIIRTPKIFAKSDWNNEKKYSYFIMEYVDASPIYADPLATDEEMKDFMKFYKEYKEKCLVKPFVEILPREESALVFTAGRVMHWAKIDESQGHFTSEKAKLLERYLSIIGKHLPDVPMEFCHGHLDAQSIRKVSDDEYVLMSNIFWTWRPALYDATFHLWAGIKSLRDTKITSYQIIEYMNKWEAEYEFQDFNNDTANHNGGKFRRNFNLVMLERCIGTILVDIENQEYSKGEREKYIKHLMNLFTDLFNYYVKSLSE